jgi:hypothetical protein
MLLRRTKAFLVPFVTHPNQHGKDELPQTPLILEVGNHLGPAPFLDNGALGEVGRAHILLMALGHFEMIETRLGVIKQAAARFRKLALIEGHYLIAPFFCFRTRVRIPIERIVRRLRDAGRRQGRAEGFLLIAIDSAAAACLMLCLKWGSWLLAKKKILLLNAVIERDPDMYNR